MIRLYGRLICLFTVVIAAAVSTEEASNARSAVSCPEITVIDIHGSGAGPNESSATGAFMTVRLRNLLEGRRLEFQTVPFDAAGGLPALTGSALKLPAAYHKSVVRTKNWLRKRLEKLAEVCQNTKVILTGYSQGAQVAGDVYQEKSWKQVVGVALFGDPYYNHSDTSNRFGWNVAPKRRIRTKLDGALVGRNPRPAFDSGKILSFCHQFDPVCQAPLSRFEQLRYRTSQHKNYTEFGEPETAAAHFVKLLKEVLKPTTPNEWSTKRNYEGPSRLYLRFGANLTAPQWASCSPNFCIVCTEDVVHVFSVADSIVEIGQIQVRADPRQSLRGLGIPERDVEILLAPRRP